MKVNILTIGETDDRNHHYHHYSGAHSISGIYASDQTGQETPGN
jgi:hypothetical protein